MSRNQYKGQKAPKLKENEAYILQNAETGEYRLMRDDFGVQAAAQYTPNYTRPSAAKLLTTELPDGVRTSWKWARWGSNDRYPHDTIEKLKAVPIACRCINDLIKLAYGEGIQYHLENATVEDETPTRIPAIENFLKVNKPHKILRDAYGSYYRHNCVFPVFTLDGNRKIVKVELPDTAHCRLAVQDENSLRVEALLYSKKFGSYYTPRDEDIIAIPLLDDWDTDTFFENLKTDKFAIMIHGESPAMMYYPEQPWAGLLKEKGWLEVSADVPILISAIHKNQSFVTQKIGVDEKRFARMYGSEWRKEDFKFEGKNKKELRNQYWKEIEDIISKPENAGKSIKYIFETDVQTGRILDDIIITPIDNKVKTGEYIPSSQAADQQVVQAIGEDSSVLGLQGMNTALGGNSGSNKRVGYNQAIAMNTLDQDTVLEIYNFVSEYNGWGVCFEHYHIEQTTTNEQESGLVMPDKKS